MAAYQWTAANAEAEAQHRSQARHLLPQACGLHLLTLPGLPMSDGQRELM